MAMDIAELAGSGLRRPGTLAELVQRPWNTDPVGPKADRTKITRVRNVTVSDSGLAEAKRTQRRKVRKLQQVWKTGSQEQWAACRLWTEAETIAVMETLSLASSSGFATCRSGHHHWLTIGMVRKM